MKPDANILIWVNKILEGARKVGRDPSPGPKLKDWMKDAGYKNIHHEKLVLPIGTWPKDVFLVSRGLHMNVASGLGVQC
jgi:hypothetical protein